MTHWKAIVSLGAVAATLTVGTGCNPEMPLAPPSPQFNQQGVGRGGQPEIFRFVEPFDFLIPAGELCDFAVAIQGRVKFVVQVFETHLMVHNEYQSTITNLATGFSIRDPGAWTDIFHFDELGELENVTAIGSIFRITIPGRGIVAQDTGIITLDVNTGEVLFEAGPHEVFHTGLDLCALLSNEAA